MMARLRRVLVWLVMAAIPLQGFAAASMLFCAAATHQPQAQAVQAIQSSHHDHFGHSHAGVSVAEKAQGSDELPDAAHKCGLCASCCHSVAISESPSIAPLISAPRAGLADPFALMQSRPSPVPDKPPRA